MKRQKFFFMLMLAIVFTISAWAQERTISGTVSNYKDGTPISGVEIRLRGAISIGTISDGQGKFSLLIPEGSSNVLRFSHQSYDEFQISIEGLNTLDVKMTSIIRKDAYGNIVTRVPLGAESRSGILNLESSFDKGYRFWFDTRVQFDAMMATGESLNPIGSGVNIRRARFAMKAILKKHWYGEFDIDVAGAELEVKDMYIRHQRNNWNVKVGHFKEGFSMETTTTSRYITFTERSLVSKLAPSRHLGIQGNIWGDHYLAIAGVHFRSIGELEENEIAKDANKDFGTTDGYSLTGRFVYMPIQEPGKLLHIGVAGSYRTPKTHMEVPNSYRYSTRAFTSVNRKKYLDTDDVMDVKNELLLGVELAGAWNQFMFQSEYIQSNLTRINDAPNSTIGGAYAQVGMLLFGGNYVYNKMEGEFTYVKRGNDWGDIEVALRFDYMNANDFDAFIYGGAANGITAGINYHVNHNVKFMLNYSYVDHDRFANGKGKLYIYQDADGNKYKDPFSVEIPTGEGGDDFGIIGFRLEVDF